MELNARYTYLSMSYYFDRDDVALKNFSTYYKKQADEEHEHAERLVNYLNRRGGRLVLKDIKKPGDEWGNGLNSMEKALQLEKDVNKSLLQLHKLASEQNDPSLCGFLESYYLEEQIEAIKKFGNHITNLMRLGASDSGLGEYLFDKHTLGQEEK
ncbi:ferritin heavy chain, oocyte isoform-like [Callorhinchus milii]|uniref:ferritin heavy chain, oocyte isoform-like n=1 Tax=Callorhinchus milii TaxID=7868 RepID=UPI0004572CC5|nr:ferritin heavy chain, oocyte isoform-like [Callorhinchus milii]|eukprot:gi/632987437/ref/XP_007910784.1/ PREDICTED: ferritin heavy chain, oocyte isoform-like [Callorhinchus milii]